jgi:lauroyl/myristoyl acyltransferase
MFGYPEPGGRYRVAVEPAIWAEEVAGLEGESAEVELTRRHLEVIEKAVRRHPEMWLWMHDRWGLARGSRRGEGAAG